MSLLIAVTVGSGLGGLARFLLSGAIQARMAGGFPLGTLTVNVLGSFILGALVRHTAINPAFSPQLRLLIGAGFCGGFTTFSTFSVEALDLLHRGDHGRALLYLVISATAGLLAALAGMAAVRALSEA